jgi:hypothetical protein
MKLKKALTIIFACILFLNANNISAEGLADRANEKSFGPMSAELLIQHINNTFGATAAGNNMIDMQMKELDRLSFSYSGQKQNPEFKNMTAVEYRKASVGSNN